MSEWTGSYFLVALLFAAVIALYVVALVQIVRKQKLSTAERGVWILITVLIPIFGATAWFIVGRDGTASNWVRKALSNTPR